MKVITSKYLQLKIQNALPVVAIFVVFLPTPILASSVKIYREITEGNKVTLKVRVTDRNGPIKDLTKESFVVETTDKNGKPREIYHDNFLKFIPPERQSYVVILLDMSGSMRYDDLGKTQQRKKLKRKKLQGATEAIQKFIEKAREEKIPVQISLAPFGYSGDHPCKKLYPLNKYTIDNDAPFLEVTDNKLDEKLEELSKARVCAATNLYKPLEAAASYLRKQMEEKNSILNTDKIPPRLIAILLSDGYDNSSKKRSQELINILTQQPQITVHTLGYGESLKQLRYRADCPLYIRYIPDVILTPSTIIKNCSLPKSEGDITKYIIDERQLQKIAKKTDGTYKLSGDADTVAENFIEILKTFREYEIEYKQPDAEQGTCHTTTIRVNAPDRGLNLPSEEKQIRMDNYNYKSLPFDKRLGIFVFTFLLALAGAIPFFKWSKQLKEQTERYLEDW